MIGIFLPTSGWDECHLGIIFQKALYITQRSYIGMNVVSASIIDFNVNNVYLDVEDTNRVSGRCFLELYNSLKMKIQNAHIDLIQKHFAGLKSKDDLVKLLSDAKYMLYGKKCKPVQLKSLTYYANPTICKKRYQIFTIKKKSGENRTIHAPVKGLKSILRSLNFVLQCVYQPHEAALGFVLEKSIVDNAKKHVGKRYVYNLDLKDFFLTFDRNRVKMGFMQEPFNLNGDKEPLAFLLASLCTHPMEIDDQIKTVLPQGSPTSPTITNILCRKLDRRLTGLANRFGAVYTRYADDITFSSMHNIYDNEEFNQELKRIIEDDQKLLINPKKTRLQKAGYRQEATGLIVNKKVNVRRKFVKQIRMWLHYWEKYGYEKAEQIFKRDYIADKGHVKNINAKLINVLDGKLEFLKMVKGESDETYKGLKDRFDKLSGKAKKVDKNSKNTTTKVNVIYPIKHNPLRAVELLKYFSSNDKDLKYTTHSWEQGRYKSYDEFIERIKKEWKDISTELKSLNPRLHAKILNFLFNDKLSQKVEKGYHISWGEKKLCFGWSSPELKTFMQQNPDEDPFNCPIPDRIKNIKNNDEFYHFKNYAEAFKNEIEFREDSRGLRKMFTELWEKKLGYDFNLYGLEKMEGFSFFTDVPWIKDAIKKIFEMFSQNGYRHFSDILLEHISNFSEKPYYHIIRITQKGSFIRRPVRDPKIIDPGGSLATIINILKNLCDYSIVSRFSDENCFRINYLSLENKSQIEELQCNDSICGFTHELKFYL